MPTPSPSAAAAAQGTQGTPSTQVASAPSGTAPTGTASPKAAPAAPARPKLPAGAAATITILAIAAFVMILNETVLAVALPSLMAEFNASATAAQWLSTGFMLTMAVVIPTTGFLLRRFTVRTLFLAAIGLFLIGSLAAALAPGLGVMLAARVIQASGTAIIMPLLMTTTLTLVPPARRGAIMGMNSVVIACAPAVGPALSGLILAASDWRVIFWIMVGAALLVGLIGAGILKRGSAGHAARFDVPSVILSAFGFGGLVYALATAESALDGAWLAPAIAAVVGAVALTFFVRRQRALQLSDSALLDLRPFGVRAFRLSLITVAITFGLLLGSVVLLSMLLQQGLGYSALTAGLVLLPAGLIQVVLAPLVGRAFDRWGPRPLVIPGTLIMALSMFALATTSTGTSLWVILLWNTLYGAGMGLVLTPLLTLSLASLPRQLYGHGSAIMNTFQQLAGAAGTALLVGLMTAGATAAAGESAGSAGAASAQLSGASWAFVVAGCLCIVAAVTALLIRPLPKRDMENGGH